MTRGKTISFKLLLGSALMTLVLFACSDSSGVGIFPTDEPPGSGERAEKGYALNEPIIAALEQYRADHSSYPAKLAELVPDYLPTVPTKTDELDFSYSSNGATYRLSFHYLGPGMNTCTYTSDEKDWNCSGAY
ncbi:MAG TPA: hypothetical protein PKM78_02575 [Anaerolineae bacterium]|nr:hypothetical protein [Anaerolineae bacterium]HNU02763.1 hypothetical protein [Anaerolineae bacterium]